MLRSCAPLKHENHTQAMANSWWKALTSGASRSRSTRRQPVRPVVTRTYTNRRSRTIEPRVSMHDVVYDYYEQPHRNVYSSMPRRMPAACRDLWSPAHEQRNDIGDDRRGRRERYRDRKFEPEPVCDDPRRRERGNPWGMGMSAVQSKSFIFPSRDIGGGDREPGPRRRTSRTSRR